MTVQFAGFDKDNLDLHRKTFAVRKAQTKRLLDVIDALTKRKRKVLQRQPHLFEKSVPRIEGYRTKFTAASKKTI